MNLVTSPRLGSFRSTAEGDGLIQVQSFRGFLVDNLSLKINSELIINGKTIRFGHVLEKISD